MPLIACNSSAFFVSPAFIVSLICSTSLAWFAFNTSSFDCAGAGTVTLVCTLVCSVCGPDTVAPAPLSPPPINAPPAAEFLIRLQSSSVKSANN